MGRASIVSASILLLCCTQALADEAPLVADAGSEALVEVSINGTGLSDWALIRTNDTGMTRVPREQLEKWGIHLPDPVLDQHLDRAGYVDLRGLPGVQADMDNTASRLNLHVQPSLLAPHLVDGGGVPVTPQLSPPGAFARYDLTATRAGAGTGLGGLLETGVFRGPLVVSSTWLAAPMPSGERGVRLDSSLLVDFPATRTSLRLGDGLSNPDFEGSQVRLAGLSWGTDFSTTPDFIPFPLPSVHGESVVPSVVDLLLNGSTVQQVAVPAGPFTLNRIPVPTGDGELTIIVRDALGREQVLTQHYYAAPQLLNPGLSAWNVDFGAKRIDYGIRSDAYDGWIAQSSWRHGFSGDATGEVQLSSDERVRVGAVSIAAFSPVLGVWSTSLACSDATQTSRDVGSTGCRIGIGLQNQVSRLSYGFDVAHATSGFSSIEDSSELPVPRDRMTAHVGITALRALSIVAFATWQKDQFGTRSQFLALDAARTFRGLGHADLLISRQTGVVTSTSVSLQLTHYVGDGTTTSGRVTNEGGSASVEASFARNVPAGPGYGYEFATQRGDVDNSSGRFSWNAENETAAAWVQRFDGQTYVQAELTGSAIWFAGRPFLTRSLDEGFALVRVPGVAALPVYRDGQLVAHTDGAGTALVTGLRPFERNQITLDPVQLPLSVEVAQTSFDAVPFRRGGVVVEALVRAGASIRLTRTDGGSVPAGAWVESPAGRAPVGLGGLAFVYGNSGVNSVRVTWEGGQCIGEIQLPARSQGEDQVVACRPIL